MKIDSNYNGPCENYVRIYMVHSTTSNFSTGFQITSPDIETAMISISDFESLSQFNIVNLCYYNVATNSNLWGTNNITAITEKLKIIGMISTNGKIFSYQTMHLLD
jgi:hypothetical protein